MEAWEISSEDYLYQRLDELRETKAYQGAPMGYRQQLEQSIKSNHSLEWYESNEKAYLEGKEVYWVPEWAVTPQESARRTDDTLDGFIMAWHLESVQRALGLGLPVPDKVLVAHKLKGAIE